MILLSRVIKSPFALSKAEDKKMIGIKNIFSPLESSELNNKENETSTSIRYDEAAIAEAENLLASAKQDAEEIRKQALDEAELIRNQILNEKKKVEEETEYAKEQARKSGYDEGFQQGLKEGKQTYDISILEAQRIVDMAKKDYVETIERAEPIIVELAIAISEKIIGEALKENKECWGTLLEQVMMEVREQDVIKIYVHPIWYERTLQQKEEIENLLSHGQELYIYPDSKLQETACIVETPFGQIDASIDSQLSEMKVQLLEKLKEKANERS